MAASLLCSASISRISLVGLAARSSISILHNVPQRNYKVHEYGYTRELYQRRLEAGPEKERRRSEWINWNYDCEVYAFGKRLSEDFNDATLRQAFIHSSYVEAEKQKRADLGIDLEAIPLQIEDNTELATSGSEFMSRYVKVYLRNMYPYMFEEGICAVHDYLLTDDMLCHIAKHIGCEDLILSQEFPILPTTLSSTFKAVVGAVLKDKGQERAETFVRDFVLPQLVGRDINELWELINPMGLLTAVLALSGKGAPEPRLMWSSASTTIMSVYWVGIYSDRQLIAKSPGETILIAEEMAAREAIKKIMKTDDSRPPLALGRMADGLELDYNKTNVSTEDIIRKHFQKYETKSKTHSSGS